MTDIFFSAGLFVFGSVVSYLIFKLITKEPPHEELWIPPERPPEEIREIDHRACVIIDDFIGRGMSVEQAHKIVLDMLK